MSTFKTLLIAAILIGLSFGQASAEKPNQEGPEILNWSTAPSSLQSQLFSLLTERLRSPQFKSSNSEHSDGTVKLLDTADSISCQQRVTEGDRRESRCKFSSSSFSALEHSSVAFLLYSLLAKAFESGDTSVGKYEASRSYALSGTDRLLFCAAIGLDGAAKNRENIISPLGTTSKTVFHCELLSK